MQNTYNHEKHEKHVEDLPLGFWSADGSCYESMRPNLLALDVSYM
jgi:hypothetical protein